MPDTETHCKISKARTGNEFRELHKWMDEATEYLGADHRIERHFFTQEYKNYIKNKWTDKAVVEWLFHIALDNLETANKFAVDIYNKAFDKISIHFEGKNLSVGEFTKTFPKSSKTIEVNVLKQKIKEASKRNIKPFKLTKEQIELLGFDYEELRIMGFDDKEARLLADNDF